MTRNRCITATCFVLMLVTSPLLAQARSPQQCERAPSGQVFEGEVANSTYIPGFPAAHFEKEIAVWRDPLTPPHTRTDCCKVEEIDKTGVKICLKYCTDCQWMYVHAWLIVDINKPGTIDGAINQCSNEAAAAGLVTGIVTAALGGGGAGLDAAAKAYVTYFSACLQGKIQEQILDVRINFRSGWGSWEGC